MNGKNDKGPLCPVCHKKAKDKYLQIGKYTYYRCATCSGIFVYPIHNQDFYLMTETYLSNPKRYTSQINPYGQRWMIEQFERLYFSKMQSVQKGTFLEVGAGVGYLSLIALARGWEVKGLEAGKQAAKFARDIFRVDIAHSTIEEYTSDETFDAIAMVEVLEHFLDPIRAITSIAKFCGPHTVLFGTTPNTDSAHWRSSEQNIYVPDDHIFLFNDKSIKRFADKAGIHDLTVEHFGMGDNHDSNLMYAGIISA